MENHFSASLPGTNFYQHIWISYFTLRFALCNSFFDTMSRPQDAKEH